MAVTGTVAVTVAGTVETALVDLQSTGARIPEGRVRRAKPEPSPIFGLAWAMYPKRAGSNPRPDAEKQWAARVREGAAEPDMLAGTERYKTFCDAMNKTGTETVMQAKRFYGRNREFEDAWDVPTLGATNQQPRVENWVDKKARLEHEAGEQRRIQGLVSTRRAKPDGDFWWARMQREANTTNGHELYAYAFKHIDEPGTLAEKSA